MEDHHWGGQCWNSAVEPEEEEDEERTVHVHTIHTVRRK
jgi:hypothetical protein